ncbi:hypothetical protein XENOCAPTIV_000044 [Xenoophorus captivus]|uniref:Uncharacterized protein n=1 Tax=Xenoophorus captivus TaxID=1517983 RepID=A0ABV0QL28_9TELE
MERAQVLDWSLQEQLRPYMSSLKPRPSIYIPEFIAANQESRADHVLTGTMAEQVTNAATPIFFMNLILFFVCRFIKRNTFVPGAVELATQRGVFIGGDDFKSGQTKIKSVLVDFLVSAGIKDSLLASPIILDLVILTELCQRVTVRPQGEDDFQSFHSVLALLSFLCKAPLNHMLLEHKLQRNFLTPHTTCINNDVATLKKVGLANGNHIPVPLTNGFYAHESNTACAM